MIRYRADWILPITSPPIRDGWVATDHHRIVAVGKSRGHSDASQTVDLGSVAIMPGLVNAHTHLELSWMRGRIGPRERFIDWIRALIAMRREWADPADPRLVDAATQGIDEAERCGTALLADVSNTLISAAPLSSRRVAAVVFNELLGFNADDATARVDRARAALDRLPSSEALRTSVAAHAAYSVSPGLFRAIREDLNRHPFARSSVHLAEASEEVELLAKGTGPWRSMLEELGVWNPRWTPPQCGPVAYLDRLGFLDARVLVVHGVQLTREELRHLARLRTPIVTCPRGNISTGAGTPPIERFYQCGVPVAVGTDSLASVDDLNVFSELATLRRLAPGVRAAALLESATRTGADALGFGGEFGAVEPGFRARLLAVDVPRSETDVEEYLVRGIEPDCIRWLN